MKRLSSLIGAMLCMVIMADLPAVAQTTIDVRGGLALTQLHKAQSQAGGGRQYLSGVSIPVSVFLNRALSRRLTVEAGIGYDPTGAVLQEIHPLLEPAAAESLYTDCESQIRLHYLSFPVLLGYANPINKGLSVFVRAGLSPQILITAHQQDEGYGTVYDNARRVISQQYFDTRRNIRSDFRTLNTAVKAGAGVMWQLGGEYALVEIGTTQGLNPIERNTDTYGAHTTRLYYILAGYGFRLRQLPSQRCTGFAKKSAQ
jgi:hypothetical protein